MWKLVLPLAGATLSTLDAHLDARASPTDRAAALVAKMTLDEKIQLLHGTGQAPRALSRRI
jgi:hypothetical protein